VRSKAGIVSLQGKSYVIHTWALQQWCNFTWGAIQVFSLYRFTFTSKVGRRRELTEASTLRTLMPNVLCPCAWWFLSSVTVAMGFSPAFSASVNGITSRASANARKQYCSMPVRVWECSSRRIASSISGAPPPAISALQTGYRSRWVEFNVPLDT